MYVFADSLPAFEQRTRNRQELSVPNRAYEQAISATTFHESKTMQPESVWPHKRNEDQRIVVTGMGLVTPLGIGIGPFWNGLVEGRSGVRQITRCDPGDSPCRIAAEVPEFEPRD